MSNSVSQQINQTLNWITPCIFDLVSTLTKIFKIFHLFNNFFLVCCCSFHGHVLKSNVEDTLCSFNRIPVAMPRCSAHSDQHVKIKPQNRSINGVFTDLCETLCFGAPSVAMNKGLASAKDGKSWIDSYNSNVDQNEVLGRKTKSLKVTNTWPE